MGLHAILQVVFPHRCVGCGHTVAEPSGFCGPCWREAEFITGAACAGCGAPLPGEETDPAALRCDDCLTRPRPWHAGVAALVYAGTGRRFVLGLKHGDRTDLAPVAGRWLARVAGPLIRPDTVIAPVPLHRLRLLRRRYNQSALLARALARQTGASLCPDLLDRPRATPALEGADRDTRFARLDGAIRVTPRHAKHIAGRRVLIVDDVMTSGATLEAAALACHAAGSGEVSIAVLARALPGSGTGRAKATGKQPPIAHRTSGPPADACRGLAPVVPAP